MSVKRQFQFKDISEYISADDVTPGKTYEVDSDDGDGVYFINNENTTSYAYHRRIQFLTPVHELDFVGHPSYYGGADNPHETLKVIEAWKLGFNLGNVLKYVSRAGKKSANTVEDLKKAAFYLNREIANLETK